MLCPKCQKENLEGAKFCAFCGTPMVTQKVQSNVQPNLQSQASASIMQPGLGKKEIKKYIIEQLNAGLSKIEIENNLKNSGYTLDSYEGIIRSYSELSLRKKYKILIWIFIVFMILTAVFGFLALVISLGASGLVAFILPGILFYYIIYLVIKNNVNGYYLFFILVLVFLPYSKSVGDLIFRLILIAYAYFLIIKLYPGYFGYLRSKYRWKKK